MNCDNIKMMISDYLDNELPKEKEGFLFTHLATCSDCREEFKQQQLIQHEVKVNQKEVSEKFEERVFSTISHNYKVINTRILTQKSFIAISSIAAIFLLIASIFLYAQSTKFQKRLQDASKQIDFQNRAIKALMVTIPIDENAPNVIKPIIIRSTKL